MIPQHNDDVFSLVKPKEDSSQLNVNPTSFSLIIFVSRFLPLERKADSDSKKMSFSKI